MPTSWIVRQKTIAAMRLIMAQARPAGGGADEDQS
jgi:hypothetical protein